MSKTLEGSMIFKLFRRSRSWFSGRTVVTGHTIFIFDLAQIHHAEQYFPLTQATNVIHCVESHLENINLMKNEKILRDQMNTASTITDTQYIIDFYVS